jgi:hypothetical protein
MTEKQKLLKDLLIILKRLTEAKLLDWITVPLSRGIEFYALTFWRGYKIQLIREGKQVKIVIDNHPITIDEELYVYGNELGDTIALDPYSSDEEALKTLVSLVANAPIA